MWYTRSVTCHIQLRHHDIDSLINTMYDLHTCRYFPGFYHKFYVNEKKNLFGMHQNALNVYDVVIRIKEACWRDATCDVFFQIDNDVFPPSSV